MPMHLSKYTKARVFPGAKNTANTLADKKAKHLPIHGLQAPSLYAVVMSLPVQYAASPKAPTHQGKARPPNRNTDMRPLSMHLIARIHLHFVRRFCS